MEVRIRRRKGRVGGCEGLTFCPLASGPSSDGKSQPLLVEAQPSLGNAPAALRGKKGRGGRFHGTYPSNFNEGTHPISGAPLRFLSKAANDATLAGWRRIQELRLSRRTVRKFLEPAPELLGGGPRA
jgi:hypothetical protein